MSTYEVNIHYFLHIRSKLDSNIPNILRGYNVWILKGLNLVLVLRWRALLDLHGVPPTFVCSFVRSSVRLLPAFLEIGSLVFDDFFTKMQNGNAQNVTGGADFRKKNFAELLKQIFIGFFPYIFLCIFTQLKTLLITLPTTKFE